MARAAPSRVYAQNVTDQDTDDPPNLMVADYLATFQTVAAPPDQAPGVQSTSPDNGATDVARDASLSVTFDEPVDRDRWIIRHLVHEDLRPRGQHHGWPADIHAPAVQRLRL